MGWERVNVSRGANYPALRVESRGRFVLNKGLSEKMGETRFVVCLVDAEAKLLCLSAVKDYEPGCSCVTPLKKRRARAFTNNPLRLKLQSLGLELGRGILLPFVSESKTEWIVSFQPSRLLVVTQRLPWQSVNTLRENR